MRNTRQEIIGSDDSLKTEKTRDEGSHGSELILSHQQGSIWPVTLNENMVCITYFQGKSNYLCIISPIALTNFLRVVFVTGFTVRADVFPYPSPLIFVFTVSAFADT